MSQVMRSQRKCTLEHERRPAMQQQEQVGWSATTRSPERSATTVVPPSAGHSFANLSIFAESSSSEMPAPEQAAPTAPHSLSFASLPLFAPAAPSQPLIMRKAQPAPEQPAVTETSGEGDALFESVPDPAQPAEQAAAAMPALPEGTLDDALAPLSVSASGAASPAGTTLEEPAAQPAGAAAPEALQQPDSAPTPGDPDYAWRVAQDPDIQTLIEEILGHLAQYNDLVLRGLTPELAIRRFILRNRGISNEQLRAMSRVPVDNPNNDKADIDDTQAQQDKTYQKFPKVRESLVHRFTVALFAGITGEPFDQISAAAPTLGLTGVPDRVFGVLNVFWLSDSPYIQLSTALHDFTDTMRGVGVKGINEAVWGIEGHIKSAIVSWLWAQSEKVSDLLHQFGDTVGRTANTVAEKVQTWIDQAKSWFGRFRRWLAGRQPSRG